MDAVVAELRNPDKRWPSMVGTGATYWRMVDLLWIVISALLYARGERVLFVKNRLTSCSSSWRA